MQPEKSTSGPYDVEPDDMALFLLAAAIQASHAVQCLEQFAADHADADSAALAEVADAITTMTHVRTRLVRDADSIIDPVGALVLQRQSVGETSS